MHRNFFPLAVIVLTFGLLDLLTSLGLKLSLAVAESFNLGDPRSGAPFQMVRACFVESLSAQKALLAVWFAFAPGKWPARFATALLTACGLAIASRLLHPHIPTIWTDVARMLGGTPLSLVALSAPLVAWRLWRGDVLLREGHDAPRAQPAFDSREFTILDILRITAFVALAAGLAKWRAAGVARPSAALLSTVSQSFHEVGWATLYLAPLVWA